MRHALALFLLMFALVMPHAVWAGPSIERVTSASGIEAWLVREPKIPMLALQALWRGGSSSDPAGKEGRASLATSLLTEGAGDLDAEAFQSAMRDSAISIGYGVDRDHVSVNMRALSSERARAFELLRLTLMAPRFDAEPIARLKSQAQVAAQRDRTNPNSLAGERFMSLAFPDHPYGRSSSPRLESLPNLDRSDFEAFTRGVLARSNLVIGVVGDITANDLRQLLDSTFGALPPHPALTLPPVAVPQVQAAPVVVPFANPQSIVLFGGPGILRDDPDYYAGTLLNYVLGGGGFNSRLMEEIREKRGLVYGVSTQLQPFSAAGLLTGNLSTRNEQVGEALNLVRANLKRVADEGLTASEIADAKAFLTGSFPLRLGSNGAIAGMLVGMQMNGLGIDFIDRYPQLINAVSAEDVRRVAKRLFGSGGLLVVVVGQPAGLPK